MAPFHWALVLFGHADREKFAILGRFFTFFSFWREKKKKNENVGPSRVISGEFSGDVGLNRSICGTEAKRKKISPKIVKFSRSLSVSLGLSLVNSRAISGDFGCFRSSFGHFSVTVGHRRPFSVKVGQIRPKLVYFGLFRSDSGPLVFFTHGRIFTTKTLSVMAFWSRFDSVFWQFYLLGPIKYNKLQ